MMHRTIPTLPKSSIYVDRKHYDRKIDNNDREINVYSRVSSKLARMKTTLEYLPSEDKRRGLYIYNAKDCISTYRVHVEQLKEAKELGVLNFYKQNMMKWYHIYRAIEQRGIRIDFEQQKKLAIENG